MGGAGLWLRFRYSRRGARLCRGQLNGEPVAAGAGNHEAVLGLFQVRAVGGELSQASREVTATDRTDEEALGPGDGVFVPREDAGDEFQGVFVEREGFRGAGPLLVGVAAGVLHGAAVPGCVVAQCGVYLPVALGAPAVFSLPLFDYGTALVGEALKVRPLGCQVNAEQAGDPARPAGGYRGFGCRGQGVRWLSCREAPGVVRRPAAVGGQGHLLGGPVLGPVGVGRVRRAPGSLGVGGWGRRRGRLRIVCALGGFPCCTGAVRTVRAALIVAACRRRVLGRPGYGRGCRVTWCLFRCACAGSLWGIGHLGVGGDFLQCSGFRPGPVGRVRVGPRGGLIEAHPHRLSEGGFDFITGQGGFQRRCRAVELVGQPGVEEVTGLAAAGAQGTLCVLDELVDGRLVCLGDAGRELLGKRCDLHRPDGAGYHHRARGVRFDGDVRPFVAELHNDVVEERAARVAERPAVHRVLVPALPVERSAGIVRGCGGCRRARWRGIGECWRLRRGAQHVFQRCGAQGVLVGGP